MDTVFRKDPVKGQSKGKSGISPNSTYYLSQFLRRVKHGDKQFLLEQSILTLW